MEDEQVLSTDPIDDNALFDNNGLEEQVIVDDNKGGNPPAGDPQPADNPPKGADDNKETPDPIDIDDYWKEIKTIYGDDFKIPEFIEKGVNDKGEKLTAKERLMALRDTMFDNTLFGQSEEDDAFVRSYMIESSKEGFDRKVFLENQFKQNSILDLAPRDFMFQIKKSELGQSKENPDGLTDDEINEVLDKKTNAELKIEKLEYSKRIKSFQEEQQQKAINAQEEKFLTVYKKEEKENTKLINDYVGRISSASNIDGIEFSEADKAQYMKELPELMKRNIVDVNGKKVAISKAEEILQTILEDNEKSMTLLPLLWMMHNNKLKGYSSMLKEQVKKGVESKLDNLPPLEKGSGFGISNEIDDRALMSDS